MKRSVILMAFIIIFIDYRLSARDFMLEYTTEWQADFTKDFNWVNLLRMGYAHDVTSRLVFNVATISIVGIQNGNLIRSIQPCSNIEEDDLFLALSVFGMTWRINPTSFLFGGIRNVNEDYFISPLTSLFTNSSCGLFPTISMIGTIANYPFSALGIHYVYQRNGWQMKASIYNGTAYKKVAGHDNVFRFCPKSDAIFNLISFSYENNCGNYHLGGCLHSGYLVSGEQIRNGYISSETKDLQKTEQRVIGACWGYLEQKISPSFSFLLQLSVNPSGEAACQSYIGVGGSFKKKEMDFGVFANYTNFKNDHEFATELTCKIPYMKNAYIQPALHFVQNNHFSGGMGLIRLGILL